MTERDDATGLDHTWWRKYESLSGRWTSPDPYGGSGVINNPQSFNRYSYVHNDPVNLVDPSGLYEACVHEAMTKFLAKLSGLSDEQATKLGRFAGGGSGGADSFRYSAINPINIIKSLFGRGPSARIHFASEATLTKEISKFGGYLATGTDRGYQQAGFVLHSIQDVHGAHEGYSRPLGHALEGTDPDRVIGDAKFMRAANEVYQLLTGNKTVALTDQQTQDLINAIIAGCGKKAKDLRITGIVPLVVIGGPGDVPGLFPSGDPFDVFRWLDLWFELERREWEKRQPDPRLA